MAYATVAELREVLPQVPTGTSYDTLLQAALDKAAQIVDGVLGFGFAAWPAAATARDVRCPATSQYLTLPPHQLGSVTAVYYVTAKGSTSEYTEAITEYEQLWNHDPGDPRLYYDTGWVYGTWYRVTALWGYGPAPALVAAIALDVAKNSYANRNSRTVPGSSVVGIDNTIDVSRILTSEQYLELMNVRTQTIGVPHG